MEILSNKMTRVHVILFCAFSSKYVNDTAECTDDKMPSGALLNTRHKDAK